MIGLLMERAISLMLIESNISTIPTIGYEEIICGTARSKL